MNPTFRRDRGAPRLAALALARAALAAVGLLGCVGPLVDDTVTRPSSLLSSPTEARRIESESPLAKQIDAADGVDRLVPRHSAFAAGKRVWYWDFGVATDVALPIYVFVREAADGTVTPLADHPYLIDSVPGDAGYSPFWAVYYVAVTDAYAGEGIASIAALQEAEAIGLVSTPESLGKVIDCPVVHPDVRLATRGGELEPSWVFYRNVRVPLFDLGTFDAVDEGHIGLDDVVLLRNEGGEPVDEAARKVDMTGDGDLSDSNNLFETAPDGTIRTPLWRVVTAAVPAATALIDTTNDEKISDVTDFTALFGDGGGATNELVAVDGAVVAFSTSATWVNCPIEPPPPVTP